MAFRVEIAPRALKDLDDIATYIENRGSFDQAEKWFNGIISAIASLEEMPSRCPIAAESRDLGQEVRVLLHGKRNRSYKVYYSVNDHAKSVEVFHVRHWAKRTLRNDELRALTEER